MYKDQKENLEIMEKTFDGWSRTILDIHDDLPLVVIHIFVVHCFKNLWIISLFLDFFMESFV